METALHRTLKHVEDQLHQAVRPVRLGYHFKRGAMAAEIFFLKHYERPLRRWERRFRTKHLDLKLR